MADPARPTAEQAFGAAPALPTAEQAFGAPPEPPVNTNAVALGGADMDEHFSQGTPGYLLDKFGQGAKDGWGTKPIGLDDETAKWLETLGGTVPPHDKGIVSRIWRQFNEQQIRPAAAALDFALNRAPNALYHGIGELAVDVGVPRDIVAFPEAFPAGHLTGLPAAVPVPAEIERAADLGVIGKGEAGYQDLPTAEAVKALSSTGKATATEAVARPVPRETPAAAPEVAGTESATEAAAQPAAAPAEPDIHSIARDIAPDTFAEYDALSAQKGALFAELTRQRELRAAGSPEVAAIDARIQAAERAGLTTNRLQIERARAVKAVQPGAEPTPEMMALQQRMMEIDYQQLDLAPDVSAAYRKAAEQAPPVEEAAGVDLKLNEPPPAAETAPEAVQPPEAAPAPKTPPAPETPAPAAAEAVGLRVAARDPDTGQVWIGAPGQIHADLVENPAHAEMGFADASGNFLTREEAFKGLKPQQQEALKVKGELDAADYELHAKPAAPEPVPQPATAAEPIPGGISGDVAKQLVAAGRPAEEAQASGAVTQAIYEAWSGRYPALGSPEDIYSRYAPTVRAGRGVRPAAELELAQKGELEQTRRGKIRLATDDGRSTITMFKDADASTFIHETGHDWLNRLMQFASDEAAPADLKTDAATVRQWLGVEDGAEIPTRAHEKFARGFERYMMEGHAPSAKLAGVFGKFRDWLTKIYETVAGLRSPINDDIRGVFDRMLATKGEEPVIAPERPEPTTEAPAPSREFVTGGNGKGIYAPVPREPTRLVDFIKKNGGLRDDTFSRRVNTERGRADAASRKTDIRVIAEHPKARGLIKAKTGSTLDDMALKAWEAGYFPDHVGRPTVNDLLEAIDEDLNRAARYSAHDAEAVSAFHDALTQNAEIDRIADTLGVNPRHMSREQFFDMAAEHMSREAQSREIGSQDAAAEIAFEEAERRAKEAIESRGDAWEPDEFYGTDKPRTLEDLESAHKSETEALGNRPEGEGGAVAAGPAAGGAGSLQEGAGSRGRGAGPSGRAGSSAGETPTGPHAEFGPADDGLVDKAGNIRLDNLNQPDDIDAVIREAADRNSGFTGERRGVISDGQMLDLADAIGKDPAFLNAKKIGDAFTGEEILAARKLLVQSATAVRDAMLRAAAGGDADIAALAQSIARHEMVQGKVAQATAEWGRAGRAFRALDGWEQARDLNQFLKQNTGRDLNQLRQMAQLGTSLQTPGQVSKFVTDTAGGKVRQAIIYYWVNTLISGPITHLTYSVGNAVNALWTPLVETPIAATSGAVRETLGIAGADRVHFEEVSAQLYGLGKGFREALPTMVQAFKTGVSPLLPGERVPARMLDAGLTQPIPGKVGYAIGLPGRAVSAIHSFFKTVRYEQNIQALAMRDALSHGLEGNARDLHVAELTKNPTPEIMEAAVGDALKELYMRPQPYNSPGAALTRATNSWLPLKIVAPFVKIGSEIVRNAFVERTPLGLGSGEVRGNLAMREGGAVFDQQLGKVMAGTGLMAATVLGVLEGNVTGDGPSDPNERRVWLLNHQPNSISVGPITFSYARLGHLAMLTRFAANMTETASRWNDNDGPQLARAFFDGITRSVLDETWMRGVKDFFDAIYHPEEHFDRWLTGFVAQWTPFSIGLGQIARKVDPYQRETRDLSTASEIFNQFKAHTPWLSETLPPRRDVFGEPISTGSGTVDRYANDKVAQAMDALHIGIATPQRKIRGVQLTPQQYDDYSRIGGRLAKMQLDAVVGPAFKTLPMETQIKLIKETVTHSRESAAAQIMMQSVGSANDIIRQATDAKAAALHGAKPVEVKELLKAH